ncbi:MAG: hypothetical protein PF569_03935, partial [Candidatus Woesearchaeota archaeon]|nr:hypothetical protein [Candidatus Woesearchaeota archaeon]
LETIRLKVESEEIESKSDILVTENLFLVASSSSDKDSEIDPMQIEWDEIIEDFTEFILTMNGIWLWEPVTPTLPLRIEMDITSQIYRFFDKVETEIDIEAIREFRDSILELIEIDFFYNSIKFFNEPELFDLFYDCTECEEACEERNEFEVRVYRDEEE